MNRPTPTPKYVRALLEELKKDPQYKGSDEALHLAFENWPKNEVFSHVLIKVVLLNRLYSTNIFAVIAVANHIVNLEIDDRLAAGDPSVVEEIANVPAGTGGRRFFSFATKYCAWHKPEHFQIYDSYIEGLLWEYKKQFGFAKYSRNKIADYPVFLKVIDEFRDFFRLESFTRKEVDKFLWVEAQKQMPAEVVASTP